MSDKYIFLDNKPIGKDLFEGQSQERIAGVLVDVIKDKKFQIIGIDGAWGTGKSNLVDIIDNRLGDSYKFFIYDVWGHQEDDQRKALLVELTEFIKANKLTKNVTKWKDKLKKLLAKEKEVTTINTPYLSVGFILSLLSIIYIPTVNTFIKSNNGFESFEKDWWRILVILLPILLVVVIYLWKVGFHVFKRKRKWQSFKIALEQTFQVYTNKQEEETKIETIVDSEPSVKDFRDWMKEIDKDLDNKKLVLVIDNFDRLPKKHILSIWSSIHIFFSEEKYNNIKIIIPFDRNHIKVAFNENGEEGDYSNDYINKTFDIVYRVSPPILSSWKKFFKSNWEKAFPKHSETEYIKIVQAYETLKPYITPREIIAFINEIVSLKLLDDSIPDRYLAIFILNKEEIIKAPLKAVTNLNYLKGIEYVFKGDENYQKYITALAYQIGAENALEVVYNGQLKDCLINGDYKVLKDLSKTKVFSRILKPIIINEIGDYKNPIETLKHLDSDALITDLEIQDVWDDIYLKQNSVNFTPGELEDFQYTLLDKISDEFKLNWLKQIISNLYIENDNNAFNFNALNFSEYIDNLHNFCLETKVEADNVFLQLKEKNVAVDQFKALIEKKKDDYIKYKIKCKKEDIELYLDTITTKNIEEANFIRYLDNGSEFSKFHNLLKGFVASSSSDPNLLKKIYALLKVTTNKPIQGLLTDAHIYDLMSRLNVVDDFFSDLACMRITLGNTSHPSYATVYDKALNSEDIEFYKKVSERIEHYIGMKDLLLKSIDFNNPLIKGIVPLLLEMENRNRLIDVKAIIQKFTEIITANKLNAETLFKELDKSEPQEYDFKFISGLSVDFYRIANGSNSRVTGQIIENFKNHFNNATLEVWSPLFEDLNSKELNVLQVIGFNNWNSFALEKFKNKLLKIATDLDNSNLNKIPSLIESFDSSNSIHLENTFKDLRDVFINNNNISKEHFIVFIKPLFKFGSLMDKSGDVLRTVFKSEFLDDKECVKLMMDLNKEIIEIIGKSNEAESTDFINGVKDRASSPEVYQLASSLKIKIKKTEVIEEEKESIKINKLGLN